MDNVGCLQNRTPILDRYRRDPNISGYTFIVYNLPAIQRTHLNKLSKCTQIAGIYLVLDIQIQICIDIVFKLVIQVKMLIPIMQGRIESFKKHVIWFIWQYSSFLKLLYRKRKQLYQPNPACKTVSNVLLQSKLT